MGPLRHTVRSATCALGICLALEAGARAAPPACPSNDPQGAGCVEACQLPADPAARASELFLGKLRALAPTGHHLAAKPGQPLAAAVSQFRVASIPLGKDDAARWRQNGLWAGPCAGLSAVFEASAINDKDARSMVDLYELHYASDAAARRVAALLGSSWDWNGHPSIAVQRGANVIVAEGRYGAWSALETLGDHFGGAVFPRGGPAPVPLCDPKARQRPIFQGDGLTVHVLGFGPSGELAWLEGRDAPAGATQWTMRVSNLVNDREIATRSWRTALPTTAAFCAEHRADAGALLSERGVAGGQFSAFDKATFDGGPLSVAIQPAAPSSKDGKEIVMQAPSGSKVLGRLASDAGAATALGFLRSPFEDRVAVLVLVKDAQNGKPGLRVLGGRLDKGWLRRE
ncbi:MAG TPA: hypothetical protein VKZ18_23550 [Polyangia bacterium]|nr:hypothetical protein [Polyangia bacterium]